jgi:hypothetical protein
MESAKIAALQEALLADGRTWGDVMFYGEQELEKNRSSGERRAKAAANAHASETMRKAANIEKKKAKKLELAKQAKKGDFKGKSTKKVDEETNFLTKVGDTGQRC